MDAANDSNLNDIDISFYEDSEETTSTSPELRLLLAVLDRAIMDLSSPFSQYRDEVLGWLHAEIVDDPWLYSFQYICMSFDLDIGLLRTQVIAKSKTLAEEKETKRLEINSNRLALR